MKALKVCQSMADLFLCSSYTIQYILVYSYKTTAMTTKAQKTTAYIIETVAPLFNKKGYVGTSMSDLTEVTGLTKGALYGNFENKESLALSVFQYSSTMLMDKLDEHLGVDGSAMDKLYSLTKFYRYYNRFIDRLGGCPILNVGVDAQANNDLLAKAVKETIRTIEGKIALVLENGAKAQELRLPVTPLQFAKQLYTMLMGAVALYTTTEDSKYLLNTVAYIDQLMAQELLR